MPAATIPLPNRALPIVHLTRNSKIRQQALQDYYENKIKTLLDLRLSPHLICLACWDAPVEREDLRTQRGRRRFIHKCVNYYRQQLKDIERRKKIF